MLRRAFLLALFGLGVVGHISHTEFPYEQILKRQAGARFIVVSVEEIPSTQWGKAYRTFATKSGKPDDLNNITFSSPWEFKPGDRILVERTDGN